MKINPRVLVMRQAITKLVPMLTQKNIEVTMRGMRAFAALHPVTQQYVRVNLPYLPDDCSDELIDAVNGFLDHEVGHVLYTTSAEMVRAQSMNATVTFLHNAIEDPCVAEAGMLRSFPGSTYNLANVSRFFLDKMVSPGLQAAIAACNADEVTAKLIVPAIRAWAGQKVFQDFMSDKWTLIRVWTDSMGQDLIDAVKDVHTTEEAVNLAKRMYDRIGTITPPPPPEGEPDKEKGGQDKSPEPAESDPGESNGEADSERSGGKPHKGEKPKSEGKDDPAKGNADEGESEQSDGEGTNAGEGESLDQEDDGSEGKSAGSKQAGKSQDLDQGGPEDGHVGSSRGKADPNARDALLAAINRVKNFDAALAEALTASAMQSAGSSDYLIFTRDDDLHEPLKFDQAAVDAIPQMEAQVNEMIGPITNDIARMVSARSATTWTGGHKSGRLHGASLSRLQFGKVDVFRRKQVNITKDVAVSIVIDISGSMTEYNKLQTASHTSYALCSVLDRLGIKCEVTGFTTRRHSELVQRDLAADPLHYQYCRKEGLLLPIFKRFDERVTADVRARFVQITQAQNICRANVDGEAVLLAATRLTPRKEARKIMLVLSDGNPSVRGGANLDLHLKAAVKQIEASGIDVVGIGIMDQSVQKFYRRNVVMKSTADLPMVVSTQLKQLLFK